jgi:hypothetical protein
MTTCWSQSLWVFFSRIWKRIWLFLLTFPTSYNKAEGRMRILNVFIGKGCDIWGLIQDRQSCNWKNCCFFDKVYLIKSTPKPLDCPTPPHTNRLIKSNISNLNQTVFGVRKIPEKYTQERGGGKITIMTYDMIEPLKIIKYLFVLGTKKKCYVERSLTNNKVMN